MTTSKSPEPSSPPRVMVPLFTLTDSPRPARQPAPAAFAPASGPVINVGQAIQFGEGPPYVMERLLGAGGMGEVYLASRVGPTGTVERLAVKVIHRDIAALIGAGAQPFLDEARLHGLLSHPNVVQARGVFQKGGACFLTMEYLDGSSLRTLLKLARSKGLVLSEATACHIIAEVAEGLDYVHRAADSLGRPLHIVHRDVSPSNIHVTASGEVKLLDFGVAWSKLEGRLKTRSSERGFQGKLAYLSPEQVNHHPVDGRSDLFSLGIVLVEVLTGSKLFAADHELLVLDAIRAVTPASVEAALDGVPEALKAICHQLLAREPSARFATGREVAEALRAYARECGYRQDAGVVAEEWTVLQKLPEALTPSPSSSAVPSAPAPERGRGPVSRALRIGLLVGTALLVLVAALAIIGTLISPGEEAHRREAELWRRRVLPQDTTPMRPPTTEAPVNQKKTRPWKARIPVVASCVAGVLAAGCPVRIPTHTRTGDCTVAPVHDIHGYHVPDDVRVNFVSLNGEKCKGYDPGHPAIEPCPAGDGTIVVVPIFGAPWPDPPEFLDGARFIGQAHVSAEPRIIERYGEKPRQTTGRMRALFTELQLKGGPTILICGVLFDAGELDKQPREGFPVLDAQYYQAPATPTTSAAHVHLYWPQ